MDPRVAPLDRIYGVNEFLFRKSLEGIDEDAARLRPAAGANPAIWVAGHMVNARHLLAGLAGRERPLAFGELFARGAAPPADDAYPPLAEIVAAWDAITPVLHEGLAALDDAALAAETHLRLPVDDNSLLTAVAFLAMHESFHAGQLGYLRKALGLGGVVG